MGECKKRAVVPSSRVAVDTFAGRIQVEWDPDAEQSLHLVSFRSLLNF